MFWFRYILQTSSCVVCSFAVQVVTVVGTFPTGVNVMCVVEEIAYVRVTGVWVIGPWNCGPFG